MRATLTISILTIFISAGGQNQYTDLKTSRLFFNAVDDSNGIVYNYIAIKDILKDTTIKGKNFQKIQWTKFKDYEGVKTYAIEFEHLADKELILLDDKLQTIHNLKLIPKIDQQGIIFGKQGKILYEFIDLRNSFPRDTEHTPVKFYIDENCRYALTYRPDLNVVELSRKCKEMFKYCMGDIFTLLTNGIKNTTPVNSTFDLLKGDEIQLFYRNKSYNDTTGISEYRDKQLMLFSYKGDTIIKGIKNLQFVKNCYSYSMGNKDNPDDILVVLTDSGYYVGSYQFIPAKLSRPIFKIDSLKMNESKIPKEYIDEYRKEAKKKFLTFQSYIYDTLCNKPFPRVVLYQSNSSYRNYLLPYFPMPYIEFGNVDGAIIYIKLKGIEYGKKITPPEKTDETHIYETKCISKNKIQVTFFLKQQSDIYFELIVDSKKHKKIYQQMKTIQGKQTLTITTPKLKKNKYYQIQFKYKFESKFENGSGSVTDNFKANY